jgi:hypothetical protein
VCTATGPRANDNEDDSEERQSHNSRVVQAEDPPVVVSGAVINISAIILAAGLVVGVRNVSEVMLKYPQM